MGEVIAGMENSYKRKNYYHSGGRGRGRGGYGSNNWNNKKFKSYLKPGLSGFLCTCNMREKDCIRESLNVLNEYADKLELNKPNKVPGSDSMNEEIHETQNEIEEIEDELEKEVSSLKTTDKKRELFSVADTGVPNNIFINSTIEDPVKLAYTILNDVATTKVQKGRFLLRIVPVEATCKCLNLDVPKLPIDHFNCRMVSLLHHTLMANLEDIKTAAGPLFDKHFQCEPTTFAIQINKRYNNSILRDELIHALALLVTDRNRDHKADLKQAKKTVLLEIVKGLCCVSVLEDYKRLRHYNQAELAKPEGGEVAEGGEAAAKEGEDKSGDVDREGGDEHEAKKGDEKSEDVDGGGEGKPDENKDSGEPAMEH